MIGWTVERACVGAWALHFLPVHPAAKITVGPEVGPFSIMYRVREGDLLNVTVELDWPGPDPRGPGRESTLMIYDPAVGRLISKRPPLQLQTVLWRRDAQRPAFLTRTAQVALHRFDRELERGYAIVQRGPGPPETFNWDEDRPRLTMAATA